MLRVQDQAKQAAHSGPPIPGGKGDRSQRGKGSRSQQDLVVLSAASECHEQPIQEKVISSLYERLTFCRLVK
jgi:hypothetical protein